MSKEQIIMKDEAVQTDGLNTTASSKGSDHSSPKNNGSYDDKKVVNFENSHKNAAEFLENLENIINTQENAEKILMRLNTEVYNLDGSRYGAPNFLAGISKAIYECIINDKEGNSKYSQFKLIQLLENIYQEAAFTKYYTKEMHEEYFQNSVQIAYEHSNEDMRKVIGNLYSDYL